MPDPADLATGDAPEATAADALPSHSLATGPRARLEAALGTELTTGRLAAGGLGLAVVLVAAALLLRSPASPPELSLPMASTTAPANGVDPAAPGGSSVPGGGPEPVATEVVVHAAGAVTRPGVYRLDPGARIGDLVDAAGGLAADADGDRLNLAAPLADGSRVYVPRVGQPEPPALSGEDGAAAGGGPGADPAESPQPVNLNTAGLEELDTLPGVGPATAEAIVAHRDQHGPFRSVDQLIDVRGIGEAKLAQLRDLVRV